MESLVEDFLGFAGRFTNVDDERGQRIAAIGPVNQNEYEHDVWAWLTPGQVERLYAANPVWSGVEKHVYGNLLSASARLRMPAYEVLAVSMPAAMPAKLLGACIDLPKTGLTAGVLTLRVAGWALGRESPATAVEILYQPGARDRPAWAGARRSG